MDWTEDLHTNDNSYLTFELQTYKEIIFFKTVLITFNFLQNKRIPTLNPYKTGWLKTQIVNDS